MRAIEIYTDMVRILHMLSPSWSPILPQPSPPYLEPPEQTGKGVGGPREFALAGPSPRSSPAWLLEVAPSTSQGSLPGPASVFICRSYSYLGHVCFSPCPAFSTNILFDYQLMTEGLAVAPRVGLTPAPPCPREHSHQ